MELNWAARIWWLFMFLWGWKKLSVCFGWTFFPPINITIYDKTSNPQQSELLHTENSSRTVCPSLPLNNSILFFIFTLWNVLALRLRPSKGHKNALTDRKCKLLFVEFTTIFSWEKQTVQKRHANSAAAQTPPAHLACDQVWHLLLLAL